MGSDALFSTVIPGQPAGLNPESRDSPARDSGFALSRALGCAIAHRGMTRHNWSRALLHLSSKTRVRSGRARLRWLFGRARLGADIFSRICRADAERLSHRGRGFGPPEKRAASRRELGFVPDHARRDAIDIRNISAAKAKRVRAAGLLLLVGVGSACRRPHRNRERRCQHQAEVEIFVGE
jgi:hypothetical protein